MAQLFHYFQGDPIVTSSPAEVRMWVEDLDYNFLLYGKIFESAEINGEKLLNITRKQLIDLGITGVDHQDILLKAVARLRKKAKLEEQAMQREDQNVKKMPTRFGKESEQLELAIERVLESVSERRWARSLDGSSEHPPHNILTAILELINKVTMMLNILERPPFDCMSEFSSLKSHLIKHITLLKHFSEQSDISHEMESDIIDVCKNVTKMCRYIISLPPDLPRADKQSPGPAAQEERPCRVQVPVTTESEVKSSSMKRKRDYTPLIRHLTVPKTSTILSYELPVLYMSGPNQRASESSSLQRANTPSDEGAVSQECDKGNKFETEVPYTEASETLSGSFHYKTLQDLTIIESDTPIDSGSERCVLGSDSDRGVVSDDDFEQHSRSSGSEICGVDSDYIKSSQESDFTKHLFKTEKYQIDFGSVEDLTKPGQHLVRVEQCQMDSESLKHWLHSGSEKCFEDSHSAKYLDSDNERKKEEKRQMVSDSIKRLMESEQRVIESESFWMNPDSESYVVESDKERGRIVAASTSKIHLLLDERAKKPTSKRYMQDSDSDTYEMDSDSERHKLASPPVKCLMDTKTFQLSTSTDKPSQLERRTVNSDSESPGMASSSVKLLKKTGMCQSTCNLERFQVGRKSEYLQHWLDSNRKQLEFDRGRHQDSSEKYQYGTVHPHGSSAIHQDERQPFQSIFKRDESQVGSGSETHQTHSGSEKDQNEAESTRDLIKTESTLEKEEFQMNEERKGHLMEPAKEKGQTTELDKVQYCHDSENEAHRLGARKKGNRPPGFWRPIPLPLQPGQGKEAKQQQSVQQTDPKSSSIQLMKSKGEDKQLPQEKLKEKHTYSSCPDSCTFMDNKYQRKPGHKISTLKRQCKEFRPAHSSQSFRSQISKIPLSSEIHGSNVSTSPLSPNSASPKYVIQKKTRRRITYSLETGTQRCAKCRMEINKSLFHKCPMNSDDSDSDSPLPAQISFDSKHSLSSKTLRHYKRSRNSPSQSLDPKHPVGIGFPRHMEDSKYSLDSTSYLHCESCSALKNLKGSTVTHNLQSKNVMGQHNIHGQVKATPVMLSKSESKFNPTARLQREDKDKLDSLTKLSEPEKEADVKYKLLSKDETDDEDETNTEDETDDEDETNTEDETDDEDETNSEDEDNTKDKKDPKDKSDPDDSDPKDGDSENNTDSNNGSDPSNATGPTSGPDSSHDADPQNQTDRNSDSDTIFDNATNSDVNLKYSSDEDTCADSSDNASGLADDATLHYTIDSKDSINPNCTSRNQTKAVLDFISNSNNDTDHRNAIGQGNYFFPKNIRLIFNSLHFLNNEADPKNFNPQNNTSAFQKNLDSNYNTKPSNSNNNNNLNNTADPTYGTKPTNITSHKHVVALSYYLDNNCVTGFTHEVKFIFVVNPKCFNRSSYLASPNFAVHTITATDTNNTINLSGAISSHFATGKSYASVAKHLPRFTHCNVFNIIINPNYNDINIQSIHNSDIIRNNNLSDPELEIISIFSILKIAYGNIPNFAADTNYSSFPDYLVTSKFHDPPELGRAYIIFDDQNIGAQFQDSAGGMDSFNSKHATESMDAPDANSDPYIPLPSSNVVVEAELPDVVKFVISPGVLNHFCKLRHDYSGIPRAEGGPMGVPIREITRSTEGPVWRSIEGPSWGLAWRPDSEDSDRSERGYPVSPARDLFVRPVQGLAMNRTRGRSMSPVRRHGERHGKERAVSLARGDAERETTPRAPSPFPMRTVSPAQELALGPARRLPMKHEEEFLLGTAVGLTVKPAEGYAEEISKSAKKSTQSTFEENKNEQDSSLGLMDFINFFMKAKSPKTGSIDIKADGFVYLPEFQIDLTPHCRRDHAFQATHARIKDLYFAATCSDEMNYWVGQVLQLASGSSFGDAAANAEYTRMSAVIYEKCVMALKRDFPMIWSNSCEETTTIVSVDPNFQYRHAQNISDEFIYFRPIDAEIQEKARKQKEQQPTLASQEFTPEGIHQRDLGIISPVVDVTTSPNISKELESIALVKPKTSGLLRLENIPIKSPGFLESQRLDVTGIVSPEERGKGTAILIAGVPGKEDLDDTEIPTLKFTGFIHLEALIKKCSPSSEYSRPVTPRNLWMESPENAESPGSDDLEVARSMYPFRERSVFRRSWAELIEAPLNSEGLHILETTPTEEDRELACLQLASEEENQAYTPLRDSHVQAVQGPFPLSPQHPNLQRQRSHSLPRHNDIRSQELNVPEFKLNAEETHFFFQADHNLLTGGNNKERDNKKEVWQRAIPLASAEHLPVDKKFENSALQGNTGIPEDNSAWSRSNVRIPKNNVSMIPMVNVGIPMDNPEVVRSSGAVPRGSDFGGPTGNSGGASRCIISSPLSELSKIGEHQL